MWPAKFLWALLNLGFACASFAMLTRLFRLSAFQGALLAALFFLSTPYRNAVGNGQTSLLVFARLADRLGVAKPSRRVGAGVPSKPAADQIFLRAANRSVVPAAGEADDAGRRACSCWRSAGQSSRGFVHESPLTTFAQPVKVANLYSESEGGGDVMTLVQSFGWTVQFSAPIRLSAACRASDVDPMGRSR